MCAVDESKIRDGDKILVVDDSQQIRCVVEEILALNGFEVTTAANGKDALNVISRLRPNIIICDVMMPEFNGFQVFNAVQRNPEWSNIPFLFLTAISDKSGIRTAKEMGCDDYIVKPFDPEELLSAIRGKLLNAHRRRISFETEMSSYRKRIIQTLSHEFRTPLVSVSTGTELLLDQFEKLSAQNVRKLLNAIKKGGLRLQELVENFIIIQQVESGKAEENFRKYRNKKDLSAIITSTLEEMRSHYPKISFNYLAAESTYGYVVDIFENHFNDVLHRLVDNGVKFSGDESPIEIKIGSDYEHVWVTVRDYGPGMPMDSLELAQQLFFQIDRDKTEQQGCGLGLSIASAYISINKGELLFHHPKDGTGLEVMVRFKRTNPMNYI